MALNGEHISEEEKKELETEVQEAGSERDQEAIYVDGNRPKYAAASQEQLAKIMEEMRQKVGAQGVSTQAIDDATLQRFLRARNLRVDLASKMYINHVKWRETFAPKGYIDESEIANELVTKKAFLQAKEGQRSVMVLHACNHDTSKRDLEETKRFAVYSIDKIIASLPPGEEKFTTILDFGGTRLRNLDVKAMISVLDFLQAQYPERLGRLFMIHVPYIFWGVWKVVLPFIDKVTREKIVFVEDKNLVSKLIEEISTDILPPEYGGTGKLVLMQDAVIPSHPSRREEVATT